MIKNECFFFKKIFKKFLKIKSICRLLFETKKNKTGSKNKLINLQRPNFRDAGSSSHEFN